MATVGRWPKWWGQCGRGQELFFLMIKIVFLFCCLRGCLLFFRLLFHVCVREVGCFCRCVGFVGVLVGFWGVFFGKGLFWIVFLVSFCFVDFVVCFVGVFFCCFVGCCLVFLSGFCWYLVLLRYAWPFGVGVSQKQHKILVGRRASLRVQTPSEEVLWVFFLGGKTLLRRYSDP